MLLYISFQYTGTLLSLKARRGWFFVCLPAEHYFLSTGHYLRSTHFPLVVIFLLHYEQQKIIKCHLIYLSVSIYLSIYLYENNMMKIKDSVLSFTHNRFRCWKTLAKYQRNRFLMNFSTLWSLFSYINYSIYKTIT